MKASAYSLLVLTMCLYPYDTSAQTREATQKWLIEKIVKYHLRTNIWDLCRPRESGHIVLVDGVGLDFWVYIDRIQPALNSNGEIDSRQFAIFYNGESPEEGVRPSKVKGSIAVDLNKNLSGVVFEAGGYAYVRLKGYECCNNITTITSVYQDTKEDAFGMTVHDGPEYNKTNKYTMRLNQVTIKIDPSLEENLVQRMNKAFARLAELQKSESAKKPKETY